MKLIFTGQSCVGKSTLVKQIASLLNLKVFDVDAWTNDQYLYNSRFIAFLKKEFKTADKKRLREVLHKDPKALARIQGELAEPFKKAVQFFFDTHSCGILDMAQFFESGDTQLLFSDMIVVNVTAPQDVRERLAQHRSVSAEDLALYDRNQFSPEMKSVLADYTIVNQYTACPDVNTSVVKELVKLISHVNGMAEVFVSMMPTDWEIEAPKELELLKAMIFKAGARYQQNGMAYHNFDHVWQMMRISQATWGIKGQSIYLPLWAAILLHDVVYDPKSKTNEIDSARFAVELLKKYLPTIFTDNMRHEVADLILSTNPETDTNRFRSFFFSKKLLHDLDYSIFASSWGNVCCYDDGIAAEYANVVPSHKEYFQKRVEFLKKLQSDGPIFQTTHASRWEADAQENLTQLIERNEYFLAEEENN